MTVGGDAVPGVIADTADGGILVNGGGAEMRVGRPVASPCGRLVRVLCTVTGLVGTHSRRHGVERPGRLFVRQFG